MLVLHARADLVCYYCCIAWLKIICYDACTLRVLSKFHTRRHATNLIDDISNYIGAINYFVSVVKCRVVCAYARVRTGACVCGVYTNQLKLTKAMYTIRAYNYMWLCALCVDAVIVTAR